MSSSRWVRRLRKLFAPRHVAREIADEMQLHIAMETEDLIAQGVAPAEARRRAQMAFGGVDRYTEEARDAWPLRSLQRVGGDLRFAVRSLLHSPSFTIAAVLALAIGMGANATVFSAVDSVAFRPLAARDPDALVAVYGRQGEADLLGFSYPSYLDFQRGASGFSDLIAFIEGPVGINTSDGEARGDGSIAVWALHTTDNYFSALGVRPALGALYQPGDLRSSVVVLSDALWKSRFASDPGVVGRTLHVNGRAFTIAGVAPEQFTGTRLFTYDPSLWFPVVAHAQTIPASDGLLTRRDRGRFHLIGRLRDGVTIEQAQASAEGVARQLSTAFPQQYDGLHAELVPNRTPINPWLAPPERIALIGQILLIGSALVLLIACVNVSSLLIARMTVRRREIGIRLSLGASRLRILQQLLTESVVLASLGAIASIPVHLLAMRGMRMLAPPLEYGSTFRPAADTRVFLYSVLLTFGAAILFGLGPALQAIGKSLVSGLRDAGGRGRPKLPRFREALVIGQSLVSVLVLVAAGLFVRSLQHARTMDTGIALDGAVAFTMNPALSPAYVPARTLDFYRRLDERIASLPGVQSSARAGSIPLDGYSSVRRVFVEGGPTELAAAPAAEFNVASPGFFATLGTPLVQGREFVRADTAAPGEIAIINEVLANRLWPGQSAIGKHIRLESATAAPVEIVGVARTAMYRNLGERPRAAVWLSLDRNPRSRTTTLVRINGSEAALLPAIQGVVRGIDPSLPIVGLGSLRQHVSLAFISIESGAIGSIGFGVLALLLAASGLYGITAYAVSQRRREIGIRVALGARRGAVMRLVAGRALALTLGGATAGALIATFVPMGFDSLLFGVTRHDPQALAAATALFCGVALIAAFIAARRAARLDPMRVLRLE